MFLTFVGVQPCNAFWYLFCAQISVHVALFIERRHIHYECGSKCSFDWCHISLHKKLVRVAFSVEIKIRKTISEERKHTMNSKEFASTAMLLRVVVHGLEQMHGM